MNEQTEFYIKPELPIGTELWYMYNNKPSLALVGAIKVYITSCTENNLGWRDQIFKRWMNGRKQKQVWEYSYIYELKMDDFIEMFTLQKKKDGWYISDRKCFFYGKRIKRITLTLPIYGDINN